MFSFQPGGKYHRADIKELAGLRRNAKGGPWDTGIVEHGGDFLIFANVGTRGRTGDAYDNQWEGELFHWYHQKRSHVGWASVKKLLLPGNVIHVFWRVSNREPFEYAGRATPFKVFEERSPVEILWAFADAENDTTFFVGPDEVPSNGYNEGTAHQVVVNVYERDRAARQACIDFYGLSCVVCGLSFEEGYGTIGKGYIHVHHLIPLSSIGQDYQVHPIKDLRPICPNCHAMVHQRQPPYPIEEVRKGMKHQIAANGLVIDADSSDIA